MENAVSQNAKTRCGNPYKTNGILWLLEPQSDNGLRNDQKALPREGFRDTISKRRKTLSNLSIIGVSGPQLPAFLGLYLPHEEQKKRVFFAPSGDLEMEQKKPLRSGAQNGPKWHAPGVFLLACPWYT